MSMWVQHKNGGEKFALIGNDDLEFTYEVSNARNIGYSLPKSEYEPCEAPEVWEDVTEQCFECHDSRDMPKAFIGGIQDKEGRMMFEGTFHSRGYRLRKVSGSSLAICGLKWAFVVERKKS